MSNWLFKVTTLRDDKQVRAVDLPLVIEGTYSKEDEERPQVWVVLEDSYGNYYLQNPPIRFLRNGTWIARNILPGPGIVAVTFVEVGPQGDARFREMVVHANWGAFSTLPPDAEMLAYVTINRVRDER